jgi:hypothetical protein
MDQLVVHDKDDDCPPHMPKIWLMRMPLRDSCNASLLLQFNELYTFVEVPSHCHPWTVPNLGSCGDCPGTLAYLAYNTSNY